MPNTLPPRILVAVASSALYLPLLRCLLDSMPAFLRRPNVELGVLDLGLTDAGRAMLQRWTSRITRPGVHFGVDPAEHGAHIGAFTARPFLREYFPGHDVYIWLDADLWLQDETVLDKLVEGALRHPFIGAHERERAYRFYPWLEGWFLKHLIRCSGVVDGAWLKLRPHLNAGLFAAGVDSPFWDAWKHHYAAAVRRSGTWYPHDQMAMNRAVHGRFPRGAEALAAELLDAGHNWICDRGTPMWNDATRRFCRPYPPYATIGALQLSGPAKDNAMRIRRTAGGSFKTFILPGASPETPVDGWPSLGLQAAGAARAVDGALAAAAARA